jgi:hypothetical protein
LRAAGSSFLSIHGPISADGARDFRRRDDVTVEVEFFR